MHKTCFVFKIVNGFFFLILLFTSCICVIYIVVVLITVRKRILTDFRHIFSLSDVENVCFFIRNAICDWTFMLCNIINFFLLSIAFVLFFCSVINTHGRGGSRRTHLQLPVILYNEIVNSVHSECGSEWYTVTRFFSDILINYQRGKKHCLFAAVINKI